MVRVIRVMLLCALLFCARHAAAQHQYDTWYFGPGLGVDFSTGAPVVINNGAHRTSEGSASICDRTSGALLFYTEGLTVYDRTHQPMPSGAGLLGSKTSAQTALIVPFPCDSDRYYIFTTDQEGYAGPANRGFHYSVVDMTRNGGRGDVTVVNTQLLPQSSEHLTAVIHANGHDAWVIVHSLGGNTFFAFQVTSAGVSPNPVVSQVGTPMGNPVASGDWTPGYLKPSPDGSMLAIAANELDLVEIFQFNNATGAVSNPITIAGPKVPGNVSVFLPYGVSFSPDNTKFYCGYGKRLIQYQVQPYAAAAVLASRAVIVDPAAAPGVPSIDGAMQIGPDGRIYTVTDPQWLGVINAPNAAGQACNFSRTAVRVGTPAGRAFLGLPNCIDSRPYFSSCCTPPAVTITPDGPTTFCEGDSVILSGPAGFASYLWSNGDQTRTTVVRTPGTQTLTVADANGCSGDTTIDVHVNPRPAPTITASGATTFCDGDSVTLSAPAGLAGYRWSTGETTRAIVVRRSGSYGVSVSDANGCDSSASVDVTVNAKPSAAITASGPTTFCDGDSVTLSAPAGLASYRWSTGERGRAIVVKRTGTYAVSVTDANGCSNGASIDVHVNPLPTPVITPSGPTTFCAGGSVELAAGAGYASYRWSDGSAGASIIARSTGTYTVSVTDANGCSNSASIDVHVNPLPDPTITPSGPTTFCDGDSVTLMAPAGLAAYRWSDGSASRSIVVRTSGTYSVSVSDANGCDSSASVDVTVNPRPSAAITASGPTTFCDGDSVTLSAPAGLASYRWSTGESGSAIVVRRTGTYAVSVTDANGCSNGASIDVTVNPRPAPTITASGATTFCDGDSVTLSAPAGLAGYRWSTGETTRAIVVKRSGSYGVSVSDANGCDSSASVDVTVNAKPSAAITASGPTTFCDGDSVVLAAPAGLAGYRWSTGATTREITVKGGGIYDVAVSDTNGCSNGASIEVKVNTKPAPTITASGPTTFCDGDSVTLSAPAGFAAYRWSDGSDGEAIVARTSGIYQVSVTDTNGCSNEASIEVKVNGRPIPVITASGPTTFCDGDSVTLAGDGGHAAYRWSTGDTTRAITVRSSGTYRLSVVDLDGCSADTATAVTVNPNPAPVIGGALEFCDGESTELDAGAGHARYRWSTGDTSRTIMVDRSDTFSVEVANEFGCWTRSLPVVTHRFGKVDATIIPLGPAAFCEGDSTVLAAPAGHIDYRWSTGDSTQTIVVRAGGSYSVSVIDTNGCRGSASFSVMVNPLPTPAILPSGPTTFCEGESVVLDAGDGYASYQWSSGELTRGIVVREPGVYRVMVTNASGCSGISDSIVVTVFPRPSLSINGPSTICPDAEAAYGVDEVPGARYRWSVEGGGGSIVAGDGTAAIKVRWGASGSGVVKVVATSESGCEGSADLRVDIGAQLTPTITSNRPASLCAGDSVTLDAGEYASYRWSTGETTRRITVRAPGNYTVTVSDAGGCGGASKPVAVTLNSAPAPVIATPDGTTMCEGESVTLDAGEGYSHYLWTNGARTRTILVRAPGSYAVVVTDGNGCSGASPEVTVDVTRKPRPAIAGPTLVCRGSTVGYSTRETPGNSYAWKVTGGTILSGEGTHAVIVRWGSGGSASLDVTETVGTLGCSGVAATYAVDVGDELRPVIIAESSPEFCKGGSVTLDAGDGFVGYLWSTGERTRRIVATKGGAYTVTVTDAGGCTGTSPELAVREKPELVPAVWPRGDVELCEGESVRLDAPAGYLSYAWSSGETTRSIVVARSGEYRVSVVDTSGCAGTSRKIAVTVHPTPAKPVITSSGDTLIAPTAVAYQWRRNQALVDGPQEGRLAATEAGIYTVTIIDGNGCSATSDPFELLLVPHRTVRLDTVSARVGDRFRMTMRITPPLQARDDIAGYSIRLRVDPKALYAHGAVSADRTAAGDPATLERNRDGSIVVQRPRASAPIVGDELFQVEMEGLASGSPTDVVKIEGIELYPSAGDKATKSTRVISDDNVTIGGHGLVLLSGCVIDHGFAYGKGVAIESIRPNPVASTAVVSWVAPEGAATRLVLVNAVGAEVKSFDLPVGTGTSQQTPIDIGMTPSGMYMLELRDGIDRGRIPVIITK